MTAVTKKSYVHVAVAAALFLIIRLVMKEGNGLTDKGVTVLGLFAGTIWLWIFVGVDWPSLLAPAVMIAAGVLSQTQMLAVSFGNFCFAFLMSAMLLNTALVKTGVIKQIATWFISRKVCKGRPWVFLCLFLFSCLFVSSFLECGPVILVYLTMLDTISAELGYKKGSKFGKAVVAAILWLAVIGYAVTPISHSIAVIMLGFLQEAGFNISFTQYMILGIPFGIIFFIITMLVLRFVIKPDLSNFTNFDPETFKKELKPLTKEGKLSLIVFIIVVAIWLLPDILMPVLPALCTYFKGTVGLVAPPILGIVVLAIIRVNDEPVLDVKKRIFETSIPSLLFVVGIQSFANTLNNPVTGISVYLGNLFQPVASSVSVGALVWISLGLAIVLTQFLSNLVVQALMWAAFLPVLLAVNASGRSLSIAAFGILLSMIVNVSFLFPSAYYGAPLCYSSGYLEVKDGIKYGIPVIAVGYLVMLLLLWPMANAIF
jgi:sodium-dependent dicarboxylate transporter 2/3/5